jgi:phosphoglycerol transferase MdoB-like AlkP superfamily enzyme
MKSIISFLIKLLIFWICLFAVQHTLFLLFNHEGLSGARFINILLSYYHALAMDIAASAYLMAVPVLLIIISLFLRRKNIFNKFIHIYNFILITFCLIITISDIGLYMAWGTKINSKALSYLAFPKEAITSFAAVPYWLFIIILIAETFIVLYIYKKIFRLDFTSHIRIISKFIFPLIILFLLFISIRGGLQKYPINKSWVYYSKYSVLNYSALNGFWNFMEIIVNPDIKKNPYQYFSKEKAETIVKEMHKVSADSTKMTLTTERPNIVLILLESVSAECMNKLGGIKGMMPGMDSLASEGLLFKNYYANGFRTEQGEIALLTGFPAQPQTTIMRKFGKFDKLPNLARILGDNGYSENYYYSGNTEFANTDAFFKLSGFEKILNENNYPWKKRTDWGAYDEELFVCHLKEAEKDKQPFFSIIMTSTNHEPFNADVEKVFTGNSEAEGYKNTVHYTDKCVWDYLQKAKSKPWYANTLFIIISDHAHSYPYEREANEAERHHIPLLFYGNVLNEKYRGKEIETIGSQIDLPAILLAQLKLEHNQFLRSKNLLNIYTPQFAYYTFDNGFGIITPEQILVYDHNLGQVVYRKNKLPAVVDDKITEQGKAFLQVTFDEYIGFNN